MAETAVEKGTKIPESQLKRRKTISDVKAKRELLAEKSTRKKQSVKKFEFKRAEMFIKDYRDSEKAEVRAKRRVKKGGNLFKGWADTMPNIVLVVRIRGITKEAPKTRKIMSLLRLKTINSATFVKVDSATTTMLQWIEPYVMYGAPTLKTINDLVYKRGFAKVKKQRVPLTDNKTIEEVCIWTDECATHTQTRACAHTHAHTHTQHNTHIDTNTRTITYTTCTLGLIAVWLLRCMCAVRSMCCIDCSFILLKRTAATHRILDQCRTMLCIHSSLFHL